MAKPTTDALNAPTSLPLVTKKPLDDELFKDLKQIKASQAGATFTGYDSYLHRNYDLSTFEKSVSTTFETPVFREFSRAFLRFSVKLLLFCGGRLQIRTQRAESSRTICDKTIEESD